MSQALELTQVYPRNSPRSLSHSIYNTAKYEAHIPTCALTTDIWMSHQLFGYINVTCNFIDDEWNLKSSVLATVNMMKDHIAENIASDLKTITEHNWRGVCCGD